MNTHINKIVTYSFLAYINNNSSTGIKDFSDVFLPLVKSAISKLSDEGKNKGESLIEIKVVVDSLYKLDMPYPLVKKLVNKIAHEENYKNGDSQFRLFADDSFIIKDYIFTEHHELLNKQEQEINNINDAYIKFLKAKNIPFQEGSSIFSFLDQNRASLSKYFATNSKIQQVESDVSILNAEFIEVLKRTSPSDFEILRKIYLGSIIAGYLEIKIEDAKEDVEFVVDTNFIISLLDLTSESSTHTCNKILEICKRLKHRVSVLDITIRETQGLLSAVAQNLDTAFMEKRLDKESIYNACDRRNLERTDLESISAALTDTLSMLGINIIHSTTKYENEARMTQTLFDYFKSIRRSEFAALHDATAVIYVRKKRNKVVNSFYGANCWFVTNTSHNITHKKITLAGGIPELIRAEDLINILWLSNPAVPNVDMLEVGLTKLISNAYSESLPSARILKEFDINLRKYGHGVTPKEVIRVANAIANRTIDNLELEKLNSISNKSPDEFVRTLREVAAKEQAENEKRIKSVENILKDSETETRGRVYLRSCLEFN